MKELWTLMMRRSFGIPDIVSDETAEKAIQGWIVTQLANSELSDPDRITASCRMYNEVVALGSKGHLDRFLLGDLEAAFQEIEHIHHGSPASLIADRVDQGSKWRTTSTRTALEQAGGRLAERLLQYVRDHPILDTTPPRAHSGEDNEEAPAGA